MALKRKLSGGFLAVLGFMLSPLSWWNDAFVNLPLAVGFGWIVSSCCGAARRGAVFQVAVVIGYWLTNALGFFLMHKGADRMLTTASTKDKRGVWKRDLLISLAYTILILLLIKLGLLKPVEEYFQKSNVQP